MNFWKLWTRRRSSKKVNKFRSCQLKSESLEPRQLLAGDILQSVVAPLSASDAVMGHREPRAAMSLDVRGDLSFEGDSNERQIASIAAQTSNAVVGGLPDGGFVVVRQQHSSGRGWDLYGQRYDLDGLRDGSTFRVNAERRGDQINPAIAVADDGSFTVVFQSQTPHLGWEVMTRTYNADGVPTRTREFAVHSKGTGNQENPSVAYIGPVTYVVAWNGQGHGVGADQAGIFAQRIAFNDPVGDTIRVNFHKPGTQANPVLATTPDNDFVIAWHGNGDGDADGIYMRRFSVDGENVTRTREIRVNSLTDGADQNPDVAVGDDGTTLVTWQHAAGGSQGWDVRAQLIDTNLLNPIGGTIEVNQTSLGNQHQPSVTHVSHSNGEDINDFVIAWEGQGNDESAVNAAVTEDRGIYARRYSSTGDVAGDEVLIDNRFVLGTQMRPSIASTGTGVEIVWNGPTATGRNGVFRRGFEEADINEPPVIELREGSVELIDDAITLIGEPYSFNVNVTDPDSTPIVRVLASYVRTTETGNVTEPVTVEQDANDPTRYTVIPPDAFDEFQDENFKARINVRVTAQDLVNPIVRDRFTLVVADQLPPELTITVGEEVDGVHNIVSDQLEVRIPLLITDPDTPQADQWVNRIRTEGDARVVIGDENSEVIVTARDEDANTFTLTVFDGTHRIYQDVQVRFDTAAPSVDLNGIEPGTDATVEALENGGLQLLGLATVEINDLNSDTMGGATVTVVGRTEGVDLSVNTALAQNITADFADGTLTLTGLDSIDNYERVLESLRFDDDAADGATSRTLEISVNDGVNESEHAVATVELRRVDHIAFAQAIADGPDGPGGEPGATFFGAHWCPHCTDQKELFQDGQSFLPFVEVTNPDRTPNEIAIENNITTFPTWEFPDGSRLTGLQDLQTLASRTGIDIPFVVDGVNNDPFIHEVTIEAVENVDGDDIGENVLLVGSPLMIPIDAYDANGDLLTFTVTSSNPDVVPTLQEGNRSARINVEGFGDMVFELFEDKVPRATERMIELANSTRTVGEGDDAVAIPFYQDIIFHRVVDEFVIQTGDPDGTGSGGSDLGEFDDQFDLDLQHNRTGLLSMAKTDDDTNDSQFFITEGPSRHLDFNHTIFGVLIEGESNRESISNTDVVGSSPTIDVVMEGIDIFTDNENAVVLLKANEGATGTSTISITASDGAGGTFTRTFEVDIQEDTFNGGPILLPFDTEFFTGEEESFSFTLEALDVEGDAVFFDNGFVGEEIAQIEADNETGEFTVTPAAGYFGKFNMFVGVAPETFSDTSDRFDAQEVFINVGEPAERFFDIVERGSFDDDNLLGERTDLIDGAPEISNEHVEESIDYAALGYSNPPTYGPHHGPVTVDDVSITPRPTGVYTTEQADEDLVHNLEHGHVWISYNPNLITDSDLTALEDFVRDGGINTAVILTPRSANTSVIAVASWARLLTLGSFDDAQIREFVNTNRGHAPEGYRPSGQKPEGREVFDDGLPHLP